MRSLPIAVVLVWCASGCDSSPAAPTVVPETSHRVFGTVTNEEGSPLAGAAVALTFVADSGATQMVNGVTGADGRYEAQLSTSGPSRFPTAPRRSSTT